MILFSILCSSRSAPAAASTRAPRPLRVEPLVGLGAGGNPLPPHVHPLLARGRGALAPEVHPFLPQPDRRDRVHHGSADLREFPPSLTEDHYASRVLHAPDDIGAWSHLWSLAQSEARADAVVADVLRRRDANQILERVAP